MRTINKKDQANTSPVLGWQHRSPVSRRRPIDRDNRQLSEDDEDEMEPESYPIGFEKANTSPVPRWQQRSPASGRPSFESDNLQNNEDELMSVPIGFEKAGQRSVGFESVQQHSSDGTRFNNSRLFYIPEANCPSKRVTGRESSIKGRDVKNSNDIKQDSVVEMGKNFIIQNFKFIPVIIFCFVLMFYFSPETENKVYGIEMLRGKIKELKNEFPSQEKNIWYSFIAGINKLVNEIPNQPSIFLLLHEEDFSTSHCLARQVSKAAMEFLNSSSSDPLELHGGELKEDRSLMEDYGILIDRYSTIVREQHTMIVYDLHEVPAKIARVFHSFCDPYSPVVDRAVIMFTMKIPRFHSKKSPLIIAEDVLEKLWGKSLDVDKFEPLKIRITNDVMLIQPEHQLPCK